MNGKYRMRGFNDPVTLIQTDSKHYKPVVGIDSSGVAYNWHSDGIFMSDCEESTLDLVPIETELHEQAYTLTIGNVILDLDVKFSTSEGYDIDLISIFCGRVDLSKLMQIEAVSNDIKNTIMHLDNWDKK